MKKVIQSSDRDGIVKIQFIKVRNISYGWSLLYSAGVSFFSTCISLLPTSSFFSVSFSINIFNKLFQPLPLSWLIQQTKNWWYFSYFPRKHDGHFMPIVSNGNNLHWNVKSCFHGKIRKLFQYVVCWKFYPEWQVLIKGNEYTFREATLSKLHPFW